MPRQKQTSDDSLLTRSVGSILLFLLAVIITLSFFGRAGALGIFLNDFILSALFGAIKFTTPIIFLILAWFLMRDARYEYRRTHAIGALLFLLTTASLFHMRFEPIDMWREALEGHGGGIFGMGAWVLKTYLGNLAGGILLVGLLLVSIILMFNTVLTHVILFNKKFVAGLPRIGGILRSLVIFLFVPRDSDVAVHGEYAEQPGDDEEGEESGEEDTNGTPQFRKKVLGGADAETSEEEDEEDDEEEDDDEKPDGEAEPASDAPNPWAARVIIRDLPPISLLSTKKTKPTSGDIQANAEIIKDTFGQFNIDVDMGEVRVGPTITQFSLKPAKGVKLTRITSLSNDLALALAAHPIRIEAPIPGKSLVGIEVPNQQAALVTCKELFESTEFTRRPHNMMLALGKDVGGKVWIADLPRMPHLLVAGTTGSGKTVCINTIIMSLLYQNTAETLRFIMVDPKRVELTLLNGIPHLLTPVITNVQKTVNALKWTIGEMERRFEVLAQNACRDIASYNTKHPGNIMPHIVFIIDELADLMASAANDVEAGIIRIAQMARAVGIHLVVATQRPSVDVITGLMKANIPARIAFSVASVIDSRTILDSPGAEKLLGRGDMLFQTAELSKPVRIQGALISEEEVKRVVDYLKGDEEPIYDTSIVEKPQGGGSGTMNLFGGPADDQDPLFHDAKQAILEAGKASASFLQRRFKVGYARAARILDELEAAGIIGPVDGAKPREILVTETEIDDTMDAGGALNVFDDPNMKRKDAVEDTEDEKKVKELEEKLKDDDIGDVMDDLSDAGVGEEQVPDEFRQRPGQ